MEKTAEQETAKTFQRTRMVVMAAAFAALADREVQVMVCDSSDLAVQKALKAAVEAASGARKERIGVIGSELPWWAVAASRRQS